MEVVSANEQREQAPGAVPADRSWAVQTGAGPPAEIASTPLRDPFLCCPPVGHNCLAGQASDSPNCAIEKTILSRPPHHPRPDHARQSWIGFCPIRHEARLRQTATVSSAPASPHLRPALANDARYHLKSSVRRASRPNHASFPASEPSSSGAGVLATPESAWTMPERS